MAKDVLPLLEAPRSPRVAHRTAPSLALAAGMHVLLFGAMSIAVRWNTDSEAAAVAELWSPLPPVMAVTPPPPPPPVEPKPEPKPVPPPVKEPDIVDKQEKKAPPKKDEEKKPEPDRKKLEEERQRKLQEAQRDSIRRQEAERLERQLAAASTGAPIASRGSDPSYEAQVRAAIRSQLSFPVSGDVQPSVYAEIEVDVFPTGEVRAIRVMRRSGVPGYDDAVERAIRSASPLPKRKDGTVGPTLLLTFRPAEMR